MATSNARRARRAADKEAALLADAAQVLATKSHSHAIKLAVNGGKDLPDRCLDIRATHVEYYGGRAIRVDDTIRKAYGVHPKLPPLTGRDSSGASFHGWYKAYNDANAKLEAKRAEAVKAARTPGKRYVREEQLDAARSAFRKEADKLGGADWWDVPPPAYASQRAAMDAVEVQEIGCTRASIRAQLADIMAGKVPGGIDLYQARLEEKRAERALSGLVAR